MKASRVLHPDIRLKFLGRLKGGAGFPHAEQGNMAAEIPFYKVKDLSSADHRGYLGPTDNYVALPTARRLGAFLFPANSILLAKVGAALLLHRFPRASGTCCIDNNMLGIIPNARTCPDFLRYSFATLQFFDVVNPGAVPSLGAEAVGGKKLPLPPLPTQKAIAKFLDRKTAAIDALIEKKQKLLALLKEKRAAQINQAVTKGLDPNMPMKDSGIPWIGEIPAHWELLSVRRVVHTIEQGWSPLCENRLAEPGEWGVVKVGCVNGGSFRANEHKALPVNLTPIADLEIRNGDLLMSRANTSELLGSTVVVHGAPPRLLLCDKIYRITPNAKCTSSFFSFAMASRSVRGQFEASSSGASDSMQNISQARLRGFLLSVPSIEEQNRIVSFLDEQLLLHRELTRSMRTQLFKLQEYRQALITAAVTGQIDIPIEKGSET